MSKDIAVLKVQLKVKGFTHPLYGECGLVEEIAYRASEAGWAVFGIC
jgi:hypothetical protein